MLGSLLRCDLIKKWRGKGEDYGIFRLEIVQHPTQTFSFLSIFNSIKTVKWKKS